MNQSRRDYWAVYLRELANQMALRDWIVAIAKAPTPLDECFASVEMVSGKRYASVFLCKGWDKRDPVAQRKTLVHELLHVHWAGTNHTLKLANKNVDKLWFVNLIWTIDREEELAVDALAAVIAPFLPLPPDHGIPDAPSPANGGGDDAIQV